ncbi:MAG: hypothetical protein AB3N23_02145 [Paracoccaceae bacterium]
MRVSDYKYFDRRLIAVVPNEDFRKKVAEAKITRREEAGLLGRLRRFLFGGVEDQAVSLFNTGIDLYLGLVGLQSAIRSRGGSILTVSKTDLEDIRFPPGHPDIGAVYSAHPTDTLLYYPISDFHRQTFESKVSEAVRILMALGANSIDIRHVSGWSREFSSEMGLALPGASVSGASEAQKKENQEILFSIRLAGSNSAELPPGLVWYEFEETWKAIAEGRLKYGLKNFSLAINYNDDYGVNSELKSEIEEANLKLSGKFFDHESTVWSIEGKFGLEEDVQA